MKISITKSVLLYCAPSLSLLLSRCATVSDDTFENLWAFDFELSRALSFLFFFAQHSLDGEWREGAHSINNLNYVLDGGAEALDGLNVTPHHNVLSAWCLWGWIKIMRPWIISALISFVDAARTRKVKPISGQEILEILQVSSFRSSLRKRNFFFSALWLTNIKIRCVAIRHTTENGNERNETLTAFEAQADNSCLPVRFFHRIWNRK